MYPGSLLILLIPCNVQHEGDEELLGLGADERRHGLSSCPLQFWAAPRLWLSWLFAPQRMPRVRPWSCSSPSTGGWWCSTSGTAGGASPPRTTGCASELGVGRGFTEAGVPLSCRWDHCGLMLSTYVLGQRGLGPSSSSCPFICICPYKAPVRTGHLAVASVRTQYAEDD